MSSKSVYMGIKDILLQEFLNRIDLETICQDEETLANALKDVVGDVIDAKEFVRELKKAYFDRLYEKFTEKVKKVEFRPREKPEEAVKSEEVREEVSESRYEVLAGVVFVESGIKKPVPIDVLEKALPKLGVSTENLSMVLEELERENLIERSNDSVTATREGRVKVQELKPTFREWKDIVSRDEELKQLLAEQRRKVKTLGNLEE